VLKRNLERHPGDRDSLTALIGFSRDSGDIKTALEYATRLSELLPNDRRLAALIADLQRRLNATGQ
jgi:hypothetical protein